MTTATLENIQAEHARLGALIAKLQAEQSEPTFVEIAEDEIELQPGERYAGAILNDDGSAAHHVVLLAPNPEERMTWAAAKAWAEGVGGVLPTRREQSLLFANLKAAFEAAWYWSSEKHEQDGAFAWCQYVFNGSQSSNRTSGEGRVRAVRRVPA